MNISLESLLILAQFIGAIALLILIHEIGHFLASRLFNIEVEEFGIGFPPRMVKLFEAGGTVYSLNWIPLGGFVRPKGENNPDIPGGLAAASPWVRLAVLSAGPFMNLLAGMILFAVIFFRLGIDFTRVEIVEVAPNSPAARAELQAGDIIESVNGEPIDSTREMRDLIYVNLDEDIQITFLREGESHAVSLAPRSDPPQGEGAIGILMGNPRGQVSPLNAVYLGGVAVYEQTRALLTLPVQLVRGTISPEEGRLVGYKGMYDIYTNRVEADAEPGTPSGVNTLSFFGSITISLGLLNLLPFPALDGGRILFVLPEIIIRRRIPAAYENMINLVGLAMLMLLMIYINLQDFLNPVVLP